MVMLRRRYVPSSCAIVGAIPCSLPEASRPKSEPYPIRCELMRSDVEEGARMLKGLRLYASVERKTGILQQLTSKAALSKAERLVPGDR